MKAWEIRGTGSFAEDGGLLQLADREVPEPGQGEILIKVGACGVCHTELDEIEGRTPPPRFPVVPGHQAAGTVAKAPGGGGKFREGDKVAVAWIAGSCGKCGFCASGLENLCPRFTATGRDVDGGYAEYMVAREDFSYRLPDDVRDETVAPLLCAGAVGYRSLKLAGLQDGEALGFTGFGASAHLVLKLAKRLFPGSPLFVFARSGTEREFARELGASWTGDTCDEPPGTMKAIIDTTPVWKTVLAAMDRLEPGGRLVINAIRKEDGDKEDLLGLDYGKHLWLEKEIKSVANVTRRDVGEFLSLAFELDISPQVEVFPLEEAPRALREIKERKIRGAKVLRP